MVIECLILGKKAGGFLVRRCQPVIDLARFQFNVKIEGKYTYHICGVSPNPFPFLQNGLVLLRDTGMGLLERGCVMSTPVKPYAKSTMRKFGRETTYGTSLRSEFGLFESNIGSYLDVEGVVALAVEIALAVPVGSSVQRN